MSKFKVLVIALIFLVAGFLLGQNFTLPNILKIQPNGSGENKQAEKTITFIIDYGDVLASENSTYNEESALTAGRQEFSNVKFEDGQTVLDILKKLTAENNLVLETKDYENLGVLVTEISGFKNGQDNKYWQYFVNGEQPQVGAGSYQLSAGEIIEWKFEQSKY